MNRLLLPLIALPIGALLLGCQSGPLTPLFVKKDRTSFPIPATRSQAARAIAAKAAGLEGPEQQELLHDLARRLQAETDPLVRETLIASIAGFPQPLAERVLTAGLADPDPVVRQQCCRSLGSRGSAASIQALTQTIESDKDFDVRVAATRALGEIRSPEAARALLPALEDNNPAMQYAAVEALKASTGRDLGGDVTAYVALAKGEAPAVAAQPEAPSDGFLSRWSPF